MRDPDLACGHSTVGRLRVLVLDNYDSFTYNLVQYLGELGCTVEVVRNDRATVDDLLIRGYDRVIVSPGPCTPTQAGISLEAVRRFPSARVPTLGVCLGHQALVQAWGGKVIQHEPVHGKTTTIEHDGKRRIICPHARVKRIEQIVCINVVGGSDKGDDALMIRLRSNGALQRLARRASNWNVCRTRRIQ